MTGHILALTSFMALLGLWAVGMSGTTGPLLLAIMAAVYGAGLYLSFRKSFQPSTAVWNIIAVLVFALFLADFLVFSREFITAASRLLMLLLGLKLFDLKKSRDHLLSYALVFFLMLAAAVSTVSLAFFAMLALYVMASIWAMIIFSITRDLEAARKAPAVSNLFGLRFFTIVAAISALSLVMTLALFFSIPRMGVGIFERKALNTVKTTGFSDTVDLGALGPVKEDSTIVMRAEFPGGRPSGTVYFKGSILEVYNGRSWNAGRERSFMKRAGPAGFVIGPGQGRATEIAVLLEPLDTEVLFAAPNVYRLEGSFPSIWVERTGVIRLTSLPFTRVEYRLWTDLSRVNSDEPAPKGPVNSRYIDSSPERQKIRELAADIAKGRNDLEKAISIEEHLKANYKYTLSPKNTGGSGPLEDFLFYSKEGYCEHFATSMVMLLSASGIHARLVTGFLEGEWNGLGNYFIVRQQDAHSWVEAYIEGTGWVRFDPTPSAPAPAYSPSVIWLYLDLVKLKWNRHIIQFSFNDQVRMALSAERRTAGLMEEIKKAFRAPDIGKAAPTAAVLAAIILTVFLFRRRTMKKKTRLRGPGFYFDMLKALSYRGIVRRTDETPLECAQRLKDQRVSYITEAFQKERYGHEKTQAADLEKIRKAVRELKKG
ncbi:MAG: DUF3488 domain-containing protein [Deltaproteobacteria bacterium]|nr:DUF3488 domain-containing protein [Deltaproteobacteria bacterium]